MPKRTPEEQKIFVEYVKELSRQGKFTLPRMPITGHTKTPLRQAFHQHWESLHKYVSGVAEWSPEVAGEWLKQWREAIPEGGLNPKSQFDKMTEQFPPDYSTRYTFFAWTIDIRNHLNRRLNKPVLPIESARKLYGVEESTNAR